MKFTGYIKSITNKELIGTNNTPKQSIVIEEVNDNEHKTSISIDFLGEEKVNQLDDINVGQVATVFYSIRATEYEGKCYNNINGWKIEALAQKWPQSKDPTKDNFEESNFGE